MSKILDSKFGRCKVNICVNCNCRLFVQGKLFDAVPGDLISVEQDNPLIPTVFFIEIKDVVNMPLG